MPTPLVTPSPTATASTWQIGTYNAVTDAWTLALDLNDRSTWFIKSYDIPQPEKVVSRSGNPRTQGERVTNEKYKNRYITLTLLLRSTTTLAAIDTAIHGLEAALANTPFMLRFAEAQAAQYSYAIVKSWVHSIPQDPLQRLAKIKTGITLVMECEPFFLGDKLYLDNLVVNPGFEAPSGPGVLAFNDTCATTNAYAVQAGGALTTPASTTWVDVVASTMPFRFLRLGEASGTTAYDIAGLNQPGTSANCTLGTAGLVSGDTDTAYTFNGTTSKVTIPTTGLPTGNAALSMGCGFQISAIPAGSAIIMAYGNGTPTAHQNVVVYVTSAGKLAADVVTVGTITGATTITTGVRHLAEVTWDGTTLTLYLDGASQGTSTPGAQSIPASPVLSLGVATSLAGNWFTGILDEFYFYNAAATGQSTRWTAFSTGATGTQTNTVSIPAAARVAFGSPAWGALNTWQTRFRWVTGLTASWYLHYTDANNHLRVDVNAAASGYQLVQTVTGTAHVLASATVALTHEAWYWLQVVQFPTVPGDSPYVQATLLYDDSGAIGSAVTNGALGPVATFDSVTALLGRPQLAATGAALVLGGNYTPTSGGVHSVALFGPGGWSLSNAGTGQASGAWEGAQQIGASGTTNAAPSVGLAKTDGSGTVLVPVASNGTARIDVAPAGSLDARWSTWDGTGAGTGAAQYGIPTSQNHVLGLALAYKTTAGLSATSAVNLLVLEYNSSGALLTTSTKAILSGVAQTAWTAYSSTYTVSNAATAFVRLQAQVSDSTANSANASVWLDNVQCWDQTANGGQTTMPYCELRFPQAPAQLVVSGLVGDLPAPASLAFGTYVSGSITSPYSFLIGRRRYATSGAQFIGMPCDTAAYTQPPTPTLVLDSASYNGYYVRWTPSGPSSAGNPNIINGKPADMQGFASLLMRMQSSETAGANIIKVTVAALSYTVAQDGFSYDSYMAAAVAGLTTQNSWTLINAGTTALPSFARSGATDLTLGTQVVAPYLVDSNATPTAMQINWCALIPNDAGTLRGQIVYTGALIPTNKWHWYYVDASRTSTSSATVNGFTPITAFSSEATAIANLTHASGGSGQPPNNSPVGAVSVIPTGDAYVTLDPQPPTNALSVSGVNQFCAVLTDANVSVLKLVTSLSYTPQYLDPR